MHVKSSCGGGRVIPGKGNGIGGHCADYRGKRRERLQKTGKTISESSFIPELKEREKRATSL